MPCYSPLKGYRDPDTNGIIFKRTSRTTEKLEVACGQCLGCRRDRATMWAMRIIHESTLYESNCFITLTYRDASDCTKEQFKGGHYIPADGSLNKDHFTQTFIRRLRKHFKQKIRYFHCGEYGEENYRPHYHACLFNVSFDDQIVYKNDEGFIIYSSPTLEKLWPYGFSTVAELNFDTAAYTAGYILKKLNGLQGQDEYLRCDENGVAYWLQPSYVTMSLKPGIGRDFYDKYHSDIFPADETPVSGKGIIQLVPRYYQTILENDDPESFALVKKLRKQFIEAHAADFTPERLMDKYKVHMAKQSTKKRNL